MNKIQKKNLSTFNYRPEIDSLRAIAVSLVVLFHFEIFIFKGGFIGVDIFFVISGYLITKIACTEIDEKKFSFINFYLKRIRRIMPALSMTILISFVIGYYLLSPAHFERLSRSTVYSAFSLANIFFWSENNYFDFVKHFKPLLHTWSLSVEIQFYILWPILIFLLKSYFFKNMKVIIILTIALSMIVSFIYSPRASGFFYFTGFRIYEFGIGSLIYLYKFELKKKVADLFFVLGILIILLSSVLLTEKTIFPGLNAFFPCFGAFLILISFKYLIYFKKIFVNKLFLLIGKLSYSIYLVHWPILIYYKYYSLYPISGLEKLFLIILILVISFILYRFVELPFRKFYSGVPVIKNSTLLLLLFSFFTIVVISPQLLVKKNFDLKMKKENIIILKKIEKDQAIILNIEKQAIKRTDSSKYFSKIKKEKKILVLGDSHARDLFIAITSIKEFSHYDIEYLINNDLNCFKNKDLNYKILSAIKNLFNSKDYCNNKIIEFKNQKQIDKADIIIVSSRWENIIDLNRLRIKINNRDDKEVIFVNRRPRFYHIPTLYLKSKSDINELANINKDLKINSLNMEIKNNFINTKFKLFDIEKVLCPENKCIVFKNNELLILDEDHWTLYGSQYFGKILHETGLLN